jgi:hypothetical protein
VPGDGALLDLGALGPDVVRDVPFRWGHVERLLDGPAVDRLRAGFPDDGFFHVEGHDGEKGYRHNMRPLLTQHATEVAADGPGGEVWQELVAELTAPSFRHAMTDVVGDDVGDCGVEASLFRYEVGDFQGPHRDLPAKQASLIVYLNEAGFDAATGGCLRILASGDVADVAAELEPLPGSAALIVRSGRSWHAVTEVGPSAPGVRYGFQVVLWRPEERSSNWTVDEATGTVSAGRRVYNGSWWQRARARWRDRAPS